MSASAIYEGWVTHRRVAPVENEFRYRVWMPLLDLDELPQALDRHPLWSARHPAPVRFRSRDFLAHGRTEAPLAERARELVHEQLGDAPAGAVRVLASPRFLGIGFNPVSFVYLHAEDGTLAALVAEVTNTPWGESHRYVAGRADGAATVRGRFRKRLHVSPFMAMDQSYELDASTPGGGALGLDSLPPARPAAVRGDAGAAATRAHPPGDDPRPRRLPAERAADAGADLRQRPEAATAWRARAAPPGRRAGVNVSARSGRPRSRPCLAGLGGGSRRLRRCDHRTRSGAPPAAGSAGRGRSAARNVDRRAPPRRAPAPRCRAVADALRSPSRRCGRA